MKGNEKGITLVALVVTIVILLILAGISISALTNTGIIEKAQEAKQASENAALEQNKILDKYENEIDKYIPKEETQTKIDKTKQCVNYYADLTGDGTVDGVIYADLAVGNTKSGQWGDDDGNYTIPKENDITKLKDYYVSQESYTTSEFGTYPVLTPVKNTTGTDRFYVMALKDIDGQVNGTYYDWYNAAYDNEMENYDSDTSTAFGSGKTNTKNMIKIWNEKTYGEQNTCSSHKDLWGQIQTQASNGWFVPSKEEWSAFGEELGIDSDNYNQTFGLSYYYWSSSQYDTYSAWYAYFDDGYMNDRTVDDYGYVRLSATF